MDYIKIKLGDNSNQMENKLEKTFDELFHAVNPLFRLSERSWKPAMDIYETAEEIIIIAEVAGVTKEDLDLEINSKAVKIKGKRNISPLVDQGKYRLAEIQYGEFERVLFLPVRVEMENVVASYSKGLLHIRLQKILSEETHKIFINDGSP